MTDDKLNTSLAANTIKALLTNHFKWTRLVTLSTDKHYSLPPGTCYRGQPKAATGHKMLFVPFVFSKSRFQGPAFRCDKSLEVHIVTLLEAIEGIPDKDYNFWGNENFHNVYERLLH